MAHYAFLKPTDDDNLLEVSETIVGVDEDDTDNLPSEFASWEEFYANQRGMPCKRYSYWTEGNQHMNGKTPFRGNQGGISNLYDIENDVFYTQQPFPSWVLNETTWQWEAPIAFPSGQKSYEWSEQTYQDDTGNPKTLGWIEV